jgi:hypothetical protein
MTKVAVEERIQIVSRLTPKLNEKVEAVAREIGISKADYVRVAVLAQLRADEQKLRAS